MVLKGCSYVGASLCTPCVLSASGERSGFDVETSHVLPQGILAAITSIGGVAADGGARACAGCEVGLPLRTVAIVILSGVGLLASCWSRNLEGQA